MNLSLLIGKILFFSCAEQFIRVIAFPGRVIHFLAVEATELLQLGVSILADLQVLIKIFTGTTRDCIFAGWAYKGRWIDWLFADFSPMGSILAT